MSKTQTTVKTSMISFLKSSSTSPVAVRGTRKKYATAAQIQAFAKKSGSNLSAGWVGRHLHALAANNEVSMTSTTINGRTVNVYGLK